MHPVAESDRARPEPPSPRDRRRATCWARLSVRRAPASSVPPPEHARGRTPLHPRPHRTLTRLRGPPQSEETHARGCYVARGRRCVGSRSRCCPLVPRPRDPGYPARSPVEGLTVDLRDYLRVLRRGWHIVLAFVAIGLLAGVALTVTTKKVYEASAQIFVATLNTSTDLSALSQGGTFAASEVQSYTSLVNAQPILVFVEQKLDTKHKTNPVLYPKTYPTNELASKITADAPLNKVLLNVHATDHSPATAELIANEAASYFTTYISNKVEQQTATGQAVVKASVVHKAQIPSAPVKPNKVLNIALGFVLGLLLGVGAVILRDVLDNTVKGPEDFEPLGIPVLGMVPLDKRTARQPIAFRADPHSSRAEAYRQLRTNLQFVNVDKQPRIIAVTSAIPGEGKTTTAMNLAAALADAGHRVVLVEADLRRPNIAKTLGLVPDVGFTTVLIGQATIEDALQNAGRNLAVLTSGPVPPNPSELLITDQARHIIRTLADRA